MPIIRACCPRALPILIALVPRGDGKGERGIEGRAAHRAAPWANMAPVSSSDLLSLYGVIPNEVKTRSLKKKIEKN